MDLVELMGGSDGQLRNFRWPTMDWLGPFFEEFQGIGPSLWSYHKKLYQSIDSLDSDWVVLD